MQETEVLKFVDTPIMLTVRGAGDGTLTRLVPARQHPMAPGLAVTMLNFGIFCVTHIPTGMAMDRGSEREGSATLLMAQFAAIAKANGFAWDRITGGEEGAAHMVAIKDLPVPFEGATYTSSEGAKPMTIGEWFSFIKSSWASDEFPWETESKHPLEKAVVLLEGLRTAA